jgi:clan AA aspartic protease
MTIKPRPDLDAVREPGAGAQYAADRTQPRQRVDHTAGEEIMGVTHVTVTIRNPAEPAREWSGLFLVDSGATDSLVPRDCLESIGLRAKESRRYELADGSPYDVAITTGDIEFMGEIVGGTIIMAEPGTEPLLGVTALDSVGIEVDPRNHRLKRLPAVRLKTVHANGPQ